MNTKNHYLITVQDGSTLLWSGPIEVEAGLTWLCRNGQRLWCVPHHAIRPLDFIEYLVRVSEGVKEI
jgi:hypothetical protein